MDSAYAADYLMLHFFENELYITWSENNAVATPERHIKKYNGDDGAPGWTMLGTGLPLESSTQCNLPILFNFQNQLHLGGNFSNGTNYLQVYSFFPQTDSWQLWTLYPKPLNRNHQKNTNNFDIALRGENTDIIWNEKNSSDVFHPKISIFSTE